MSTNFTHYETVLMMLAIESYKAEESKCLSELQSFLHETLDIDMYPTIQSFENNIATLESALDKLYILREMAAKEAFEKSIEK